MAHQGEIIEGIIKRSGESISSISQKLKITRATLYNWLREETVPSDKIDRIGAAIGVDIYSTAPNVFGSKSGVKIVKGNSTDHSDIANFWKDKYITVMEDNLRLKDKVSKLKEELEAARIEKRDMKSEGVQ